MKREYVKPSMIGERFVADEYVAACITGVIQCVYPGTSKTGFDDGTKAVIAEDGLWHGVCGNDATISFAGDTAKGYEVVSGRIDYNRPIRNVTGYKEEPGDYYGVTWESTDNNWSDTYQHKGRLKITNIDNNRPNHS